MKIYLVRHGQSQWQVDQQPGAWNSPLSELGRLQAQRLADWLALGTEIGIDQRLPLAALHASPYLRAQETAAPIAAALSLPLVTQVHLHEADFLVSERLPSRSSPRAILPPFEPDPEYAALKERAQQVLVELADRGGGGVMAVSHGGMISTILRLAAGSDHVSFWIYNAGINLIEWKRGRWHLVFLNLLDHLPPELRTY